ncbi:MAG: isoleucine--tRNA ligase [Verrucomicrobiota bacterium]
MNYKDTLNLPATAFPMRASLPKREPLLLAKWQTADLYGRVLAARREGVPFLLHDGPPFANGDAHIGHLLNKALKDIVLKYKNMTGHYAPYVPGWDCHGLPIEYKVMKELGGKVTDPVEIRRRCAETAEKFIGIQCAQFQRLGVLGQWDRPYVTMRPEYEAEVLRLFADLVEQDMVYEGLRPVLWSTGCRTALAEAEVEYHQKNDPAIYVKFPLTPASCAQLGAPEGTALLIWTTTPWTLPANLAVAVAGNLNYHLVETERAGVVLHAVDLTATLHAKSDGATQAKEGGLSQFLSGEDLAGIAYTHPFLERTGKIYTADFVTAEAGTGLVHIAPGHGADDYQLGLKHDFFGHGVYSPVDEAGKYTEDFGPLAVKGKKVFDANEDVIQLLEEKKLLLAREDYLHDYPYCWRSKTPIVYRAVKQWFIKMDAFRADALAAIDTVEWIPSWGRNRIYGAIENRPDWCISRQRSWGIPIPVFYGEGGQSLLNAKTVRAFADLVEKEGTDVWFATGDAEMTQRLGLPGGLRKGRDTLDVWIDSGSSHRAVVAKRPEYAPWRDGQNPVQADLYLEGSDQHRGWFNSSLSLAVAGNADRRAPYKAVLTHGFVVNDQGKKYSKSDGAVDLHTLVDEFGADVTRLWVASVEYRGDLPFQIRPAKHGREIVGVSDTYRAIRNTLRILLGNVDGFDRKADGLPYRELQPLDQYMVWRTWDLIQRCGDAYEKYEFHRVFHDINQFCANDLSALYVDVTKDRLYCDGADWPSSRAVQTVMHETAEALCGLLAPLIPFTAEEAWQVLRSGRLIDEPDVPLEDSVHLQDFPLKVWGAYFEKQGLSPEPAVLERWEKLLKLRGQVNEKLEGLRRDKTIGKSLEARVELSGFDFITPEDRATLEELFIVSQVEITEGVADQPGITVGKARGERCARSWKYAEDAVRDEDGDGDWLSPRDARAMAELRRQAAAPAAG